MSIKEIFKLVEGYNTEIILGLALGLVILLIFSIISQVRISAWKKRYKELLRGGDSINMEELLLNINRDLTRLDEEVAGAGRDIKNINDQLSYAVQKMGMVRYNAFEDQGSGQSFSLALLDSHNTGFIITSIYGRDYNANYLKPIEKSQPVYQLSQEEEAALDKALKS